MVNKKASFFALVASLLLSVTRATTQRLSALATRREEEDRKISGSDVLFTVVGILCEIYTCKSLLAWIWISPSNSSGPEPADRIQNSAWQRKDDTFAYLLADIGFQVGKLFPGPKYNCDSLSQNHARLRDDICQFRILMV
jgi:hypothetical protein